jgi:hypothetical protein
VLAACVCAPTVRGEENLSKREVAALGKAAAALVELDGKTATGSAFCINASGLFLTNEHVIRGQGIGGKIRLVMNSSLKDQKVYQARVIRADAELDLALLRTEGTEKLPALMLGSDEKLDELTELVAIGFPFGKSLALDRGTFPAVSVNVGTITSLRRKDGKLSRIQMDAGVNPGHSGGAVLDMRGRVIGIVESGILGTTVNFAIPVSQMERFLATPDLQFTPPALVRASMHKPAVVRAKAVYLLPAAKPVDLELIVKIDDGQERRFPMEAADGGYRATVVPVPAHDGPMMLRLSADYGNGTLSGSVADQAFKVGTRQIRLRDIRGVQLQPKPQVVLADGKVLEGAVTGLETVTVQLGEEKRALNLLRAVEIKVEPLREVASVTYILVAKRGQEEIGRQSETVVLGGGTGAVAAGSPAGIRPPLLEKDRAVRTLPAPVADLAVGRGGRLVILHLAKANKLAIFDVNQAKIVHYLPAPEENLRLAAGQDKLLVALPGAGILQRWNLTTFQRETSVPLPIKGPVRSMAMGASSQGPLALYITQEGRPHFGVNQLCFVDVRSMKRLEIGWLQPAGRMNVNHSIIGQEARIRASADGKTFGLWSTSQSPTGLTVIQLVGANAAKGAYEHTSVGHVLPGPDGKVIFTGQQLYTADLSKLRGERPNGTAYFPALGPGGAYYLGYPAQYLTQAPPRPPGRAQREPESKLAVHMLGEDRPLLTLATINLPVVDAGSQQSGSPDFTYDKRVLFLPQAKLILTIPASNDQLVLHRLDVDAALAKSGGDYLFVTSEAPQSAPKGALYTYTVAVKSRKGGVKYRIESGPAGMTVSGNGKVVWRVPAGYPDPEVTVILVITDAAGQERFHTFTIAVRD